MQEYYSLIILVTGIVVVLGLSALFFNHLRRPIMPQNAPLTQRAQIHHDALNALDRMILGTHNMEKKAQQSLVDVLNRLRRMGWLYGSDEVYRALSGIYALSIAGKNLRDDDEMFRLYRRLLILLRKDLPWQKDSQLRADDYLRCVIADYDAWAQKQRQLSPLD